MTGARRCTAETPGFRDREGEALTGLDAFDRLFAGVGLSLQGAAAFGFFDVREALFEKLADRLGAA
jgi:hypothetical protein